MIAKNTWVQIHKIVLKPEERPVTLPEETRKVPLELWVKGFLLAEANLNDVVTVRTVTGRLETGTLIQAHPCYLHNYGAFVPEILDIDRIVKEAFMRGEEHE
jgi:hypothetical protein